MAFLKLFGLVLAVVLQAVVLFGLVQPTVHPMESTLGMIVVLGLVLASVR